MPQDHLAGAASADPEWRAVFQPAGKAALARLRIVVAQPAPGLDPQASAQHADRLAVRGAEHHIEQELSGLFLGRQGAQGFQQLGNRHAGLWLELVEIEQPRRSVSCLPVVPPAGGVDPQPLGLEIQSAGFHQRRIPGDAATRCAAIDFVAILAVAIVGRLLLVVIHQPGVDEQFPQAAQWCLQACRQWLAGEHLGAIQLHQFVAIGALPGQAHGLFLGRRQQRKGTQQPGQATGHVIRP